MNKYEKYDDYYNEYQNQIRVEDILVEGESVLWKGRPNRKAYLINSIFGPLAPLALLWLLFDGAFIVMMISSGEVGAMLAFIIPFFAIHLLPVWLWLGQILSAKKRWENTEYAVTDKRILIKTGFWGVDFKTVYYKDIKNVTLRKSLIDSMFGVADIYFDISNNYIYPQQNQKVHPYAMFDLENPYELYTKLQKTVLDIQTDIEYPNAYRPDENPGYNTKYKGM